MKSRISIIMVFLTAMIKLYSCSNKPNVYNHTEDIVELGQNYYYLGDGRESQILLNLKSEGKSKFGKTIIPPEIIRYNYDDTFIIAQTLERSTNKNQLKYWIIDKSKSNPDAIMPLDSVHFYMMIDSMQLKAKLKPR